MAFLSPCFWAGVGGTCVVEVAGAPKPKDPLAVGAAGAPKMFGDDPAATPKVGADPEGGTKVEVEVDGAPKADLAVLPNTARASAGLTPPIPGPKVNLAGAGAFFGSFGSLGAPKAPTAGVEAEVDELMLGLNPKENLGVVVAVVFASSFFSVVPVAVLPKALKIGALGVD